MKKLFLISIFLLVTLVGCGDNEKEVGEEMAENTDYLSEVVEIVNNTYNFESIEYKITDSQIPYESATYLLSRNPTMGYMSTEISEDMLVSFKQILIKDENVMGDIMPAENATYYGYELENPDAEAFILPNQSLGFYRDDEFRLININVKSYNLFFENPNYVENILKTETGYVLELSDDYFDLIKENQISFAKEQLKLPMEEYTEEQKQGMIDVLNISILMAEGREYQNFTIKIDTDGKIATNITQAMLILEPEPISATEVSEEKIENNIEIALEVLKFNENEAIISEINSIYEELK